MSIVHQKHLRTVTLDKPFIFFQVQITHLSLNQTGKTHAASPDRRNPFFLTDHLIDVVLSAVIPYQRQRNDIAVFLLKKFNIDISFIAFHVPSFAISYNVIIGDNVAYFNSLRNFCFLPFYNLSHFFYTMYMELKEIIREYKERTGLSDSEIARRVGVSRSTATRWSSGEIRKVGKDTLDKLSELVGYNIEPLLLGMDISVRLPVLGYVKAGYDLFAEENYLGEEETSLNDRKAGDYYLKVSGDSMKGIGILDGSLVLVRRCSTLNNGDIGVVLIGDEVTVKRVLRKDRVLILEAANPDVETRYFSPKEIRELPVQIIGRVISCKTYF